MIEDELIINLLGPENSGENRPFKELQFINFNPEIGTELGILNRLINTILIQTINTF